MIGAMVYALLFLVVVVVELAREKDERIDYLTIFHGFFVVYYVVPGFMLAVALGQTDLGFGLHTIDRGHQSITAALVAAGYASVLVGFAGGRRWIRRTGVSLICRRTSSVRLVSAAVLLLTCGGLAVMAYVAQYGDLLTAVARSTVIRSGGVESGAFVFVKRFIPLVFLATILTISGVFMRPRSRGVWIVLSLLSIPLTILGFLLLSGRGYLIQVAIVIYWVAVVLGNRWHWRGVLTAAVLGVVVILFGDALFISLRQLDQGPAAVGQSFLETARTHHDDEGLARAYLDEFQHYPVSAVVAEANSHGAEASWRWFSDVATGILSYLPEQLIRIDLPDNVSVRNTYALQGLRESRVPPGFVGFGLYSAGWFGVVVTGTALGLLGAIISGLLVGNRRADPWQCILYASWGVAWAFGGLQGDPKIFLHSNFALILVTIVSVGGRLVVRHAGDAGRSKLVST